MRRSNVFGSRLRMMRLAAGLSLSELGRLINYDPSLISRVENGLRSGSAQFAAACDEALRGNGELVRLAGAGPSNLLPAGPLIGREEEVAQIVRWLDPREGKKDDQPTVCVLHGMGGIGKTSLALAVAHRIRDWFPDGRLYFDLRGYRLDATPATEEEVLERMLRMLGVPAKAVPPDFDDRAALYRSRVAELRMLLILDSASTIRQVRALIPPNPASSVIITSRRRLAAFDQAFRLEVGELSAPAAVQLFRAVGRLDDSESGRDDPARVHSIAALCHRIPLAIHIVGGRFRENVARTLQDVENSLRNSDSMFQELDDDERSLSATFAESCATLSSVELKMLSLLAHYPGVRITDSSAAALFGTKPALADQVLDRLMRYGMLEPSFADSYHLHDLFRDYLVRQHAPTLSEADRKTALTRLFDYYLRTAAAADHHIAKNRYSIQLHLFPDPPFVVEISDAGSAESWMKQETDNFLPVVRLMMDYQAYEVCWQFVYCLRGYFFAEKPSWSIWIESFQIAASAARLASDRWAEAVSMNNLGLALTEHGELSRAEGCYIDAHRMFREIGDQHGEMNAVANTAWLNYSRGNYVQAHDQANQTLAFYESTDQRANAAIAMDCIARCELAMRRPHDAREHFEKTLAEFHELAFAEDHAAQVRTLLAEAVQQLAEGGLGTGPDRHVTNNVGRVSGHAGNHIAKVELIMGDKYETTGPVLAVGRNARAEGLAIQHNSEGNAAYEVAELARDLETLRLALRQQATTREHDVSVAEIAAAATAADNGDLPETHRRLKRAGRWALDAATGTGTGLAAAALAKALGC